MTKIVLFCASGMSTSLMETKMLKAANERGFECAIKAFPVSKCTTEGRDADIILLGPQVRFNKTDVEKKCPGIPVEIIDLRDYGTMNGAHVIDHVMEVLNIERK